MAEDPVHHVTLTLSKGFEFVVTFDDLSQYPPLQLDEPAPLGEGHGPNAAALVAAAAGNCLAASLLFCLRKSRASVGALRARVAARVDRNDEGCLRISRIDVELEPDLDAEDLAKLELRRAYSGYTGRYACATAGFSCSCRSACWGLAPRRPRPRVPTRRTS